jgi:hypothetical protein
MRVRARFDQVLTTGLPNMVSFDSKDLTAPVQSFVPDVIPAEMVDKARGYKECDFREGDADTFYVNTKALLGTKISYQRITRYNASLKGTTANRTRTVERFASKYMGLHQVRRDGPIEEGRPTKRWTCDCLGFWHDLVCSHTLVIMDHHGEYDLAANAASLPRRKRSGRPNASKDCLQRQEMTPDRETQQTAKGKSRRDAAAPAPRGGRGRGRGAARAPRAGARGAARAPGGGGRGAARAPGRGGGSGGSAPGGSQVPKNLRAIFTEVLISGAPSSGRLPGRGGSVAVPRQNAAFVSIRPQRSCNTKP